MQADRLRFLEYPDRTDPLFIARRRTGPRRRSRSSASVLQGQGQRPIGVTRRRARAERLKSLPRHCTGPYYGQLARQELNGGRSRCGPCPIPTRPHQQSATSSWLPRDRASARDWMQKIWPCAAGADLGRTLDDPAICVPKGSRRGARQPRALLLCPLARCADCRMDGRLNPVAPFRTIGDSGPARSSPALVHAIAPQRVASNAMPYPPPLRGP